MVCDPRFILLITVRSAIDQVDIEQSIVVVIEKCTAGTETFRHKVAAIHSRFMDEIDSGMFCCIYIYGGSIAFVLRLLRFLIAASKQYNKNANYEDIEPAHSNYVNLSATNAVPRVATAISAQ